eukprot:CAMPEP_0113535682 /NCGR_PEP_ID=MMETSP0015_2-20120614/5849_1 /TAXON_ID=2838 /ORGANISM="Odontella" /LENGTH=49 /DNA_ID=CAMNT_0000434979 /DNA_START=206 /DNA_END=356 /DNA_ORIENTATION=+ /assembly_acc=CAM_ASM_000160
MKLTIAIAALAAGSASAFTSPPALASRREFPRASQGRDDYDVPRKRSDA